MGVFPCFESGLAPDLPWCLFAVVDIKGLSSLPSLPPSLSEHGTMGDCSMRAAGRTIKEAKDGGVGRDQRACACNGGEEG